MIEKIISGGQSSADRADLNLMLWLKEAAPEVLETILIIGLQHGDHRISISNSKDGLMEKELFINSISMVDFDDSYNIPTVLLYQKGGGPLIGTQALSSATSRLDLNEDFKVDLGFIEPGSSNYKRDFVTFTGERKSAAGLCADFFNSLFIRVRDWLASNALDPKVSVLIAEPLALQGELATPEWLSNYRNNLRRILGGEKYRAIDFMPEPFAVFQYYRHGLKHPMLSGRHKRNVLILDFGGGTFDVCIIETTKEGDISQSGRNSKPLAASSAPIGGYFINRMIAEAIVKKHYDSSKSNMTTVSKALEVYKNWRKNATDFSTLADKYKNFILKFHSLVYKVELAKIGICKNISDWNLESRLSISYPLSIPNDFFTDSSGTIMLKITGEELKEIFIRKIWNPYLKQEIQKTINRGKQELQGSSISLILLSGGSSNIGWLRHLIRRDFADDFLNTEILKIPDFQEVVAKGLAVECARKFHNRDGDFSSVTYNRLCLLLDPDSSGYEPKTFKPKTSGLPDLKDKPGVLLPSASVLQKFVDKQMIWKVKLSKPPKHKLDYYFLRSSFDPDDIDNLQNIVDHTVFTPKGAVFDASTQVELLLKDDGTVYPKFTYKTGKVEADKIAVEGRPFCLDMTWVNTNETANAYVGIDFGTSNSAVSYVDQSSITVYKKMAAETTMVDISDLISKLPYPVSLPLSLYLSTQVNPETIFQKSRDFIESSLCLISYLVYLEYCHLKCSKNTKLFKGYTQRSAGPLWKLLKETTLCLKNRTENAKHLSKLIDSDLGKEVENIINLIALAKHDKVDVKSINHSRVVKIIANLCSEIFKHAKFGYFENVQKEKFGKSFTGLFRVAHGPQPHFYEIYKYRGASTFSEDDPVLYNPQTETGLSLQPLIFWEKCCTHPDLDNGHCYMFDKANSDGSFSYKAVGYSCQFSIDSRNVDMAGMVTALQGLKEEDCSFDEYAFENFERIQNG
jgi:hypothetical protein